MGDETRFANLTSEERKWLEIGECMCEFNTQNFPRCDKSYLDVSRRGEVILMNMIRGLSYIQKNLGVELAKGTIFEKIPELTSVLSGITTYTIGLKIEEMEVKNGKRQAAKEYWTQRNNIRKRRAAEKLLTEEYLTAPSTSNAHFYQDEEQVVLENQEEEEEEEEEAVVENEESGDIEENNEILLNVKEEEGELFNIEHQIMIEPGSDETIISSDQYLLISTILQYPRVIFCWGDFLRDNSECKQFDGEFQRQALIFLETTGLVTLTKQETLDKLEMTSIFVKETRESLCISIYSFGLTFEEYLKIHFLHPHPNRRPLSEQILLFDRNFGITLDSRNTEKLENIMALAIIQLETALVTPSRVKVKNLKMIDDVFNRMQATGLLKAFNTTYADAQDWEFKKQLCGEDLEERLKIYGLNSSFFFVTSLLDISMMMKEQQQKQKNEQMGNQRNTIFLQNEVKPFEQ